MMSCSKIKYYKNTRRIYYWILRPLVSVYCYLKCLFNIRCTIFQLEQHKGSSSTYHVNCFIVHRIVHPMWPCSIKTSTLNRLWRRPRHCNKTNFVVLRTGYVNLRVIYFYTHQPVINYYKVLLLYIDFYGLCLPFDRNNIVVA